MNLDWQNCGLGYYQQTKGGIGKAMHRSTILVVDDEATVRHVVRKMLGDDYLVLEATDGEVALDMAHRHQPDIILMDIMMPKLDGYSACHMLKTDQTTKHIPIIMLTAVGYALNKKLAKKIKAQGYITKPFTQQDLLHTIGRLTKRAK